MLLGFKRVWFSILFVGISAIGIAQQVDGLIYNLRQNWEQYDEKAKSFLPAISQISGDVISFKIDGSQYENYILYIQTSKPAYLFFEDKLIGKLENGEHHFKVDSLLRQVGSSAPTLSIYGEDIKEGLITYIVSNSFATVSIESEDGHFRNKTFTSFFIIASIILLIGLILIKLNSKDLFIQYASVFRVFNFNTIDELIYKGRFFVNPGMQMIIWMSTSASFSLYYLIIKLNIYFFDISSMEAGTIAYHSIYVLFLIVGFVAYFLLKFLLIYSLSSVFDMQSSKNIHYASHLRLTFYLLIVLQTIITLDYFSIIGINRVLFLVIIFGALLTIIIFIGIRLSFIIRHSFIQLFLYLCGTEIFLYVFVYKLVVG
jgi:uncharacterized protein DUF4271